jgi:hypothetical protein
VDEHDASDLVSKAWNAIDNSTLPKTPELQAAALPAVMAALSGSGGGVQAVEGTYLPAVVSEPSGGLLDRLASRLQLSRDVVEEVFMEDGDGLVISVHPARLAASKSAGARQITLLVTAMRQAAGEEQTPIDEIRKVAIDFGKYDAPNFASAVNELRGGFLFKGPTRQRTLRLTRAGWAQTSDLIRELAGRG